MPAPGYSWYVRNYPSAAHSAVCQKRVCVVIYNLNMYYRVVFLLDKIRGVRRTRWVQGG